MNHQFSVILDFVPVPNNEILDIADVLGTADCLDASVSGHSEGIEVIFNREAETVDAAIKSAVTAVESAGYPVKRVEAARELLMLET